jgi:TRAP-type C4-dicarboxylate transport system permease small subunit
LLLNEQHPTSQDEIAQKLFLGPLLSLTQCLAAVFLCIDLMVVIGSVVARSLFLAPLEWADDVARGLMVASAFFGSACAIAKGENPGVVFFVDRCSKRLRSQFESLAALLVCLIAGYIAFHTLNMSLMTTGQTTGSGLPLQLTFYPMGVGALMMTLFSAETLLKHPKAANLISACALVLLYCLYMGWDLYSPSSLPSPQVLMLIGFLLTLLAGVPIGFVLALCALIFNFTDGSIPGVIFAQQMARGIDNFVLLAIPYGKRMTINSDKIQMASKKLKTKIIIYNLIHLDIYYIYITITK